MIKSISKARYIGGFLSANILSTAMVFTGSHLFYSDLGYERLGTVLIYSAILPLIIAIVLVCKILYLAWSALKDGNPRTTPAKAIGFLFIPLFNLFWVFPAVWGYSQDYNSFIRKHNPSLGRLPENLFLACCISFPVAFLLRRLPIVGPAISLINLALFTIVLAKICDAINGVRLSLKISS